MARPRKYTTQQIKTISDQYFKDVDSTGRMPTISGLSLSLKVDMETLRNWAKGKDPYYSALMREVMSKLVSYWEPLLSITRGNTSGIQFWLKSVAAWRDTEPTKETTEVTANGIKLVMIKKEMPPTKSS